MTKAADSVVDFLAIHDVIECTGCGAVFDSRDDFDAATLEHDPVCTECAGAAEHAQDAAADFRGPR